MNYEVRSMGADERKRELGRRRVLLFGQPLDERGIEVIERRFECHLPCFQGGRGNFDALDAMRRDAYREVCMWLRDQLKQYKNEREQ